MQGGNRYNGCDKKYGFSKLLLLMFVWGCMIVLINAVCKGSD